MRSSLPTMWAWILASFLGVAALQAWPLPRHLATHLTGDPGGDTGVYVWNPWVFRHELVDRHSSPFKTTTILPLDGPADLSLHNYTVVTNVAALPLLPLTGVITTFNLIYLCNVALAGFGMYLLARHVFRDVGIGTAEAWLAGLLFACSPWMAARSTAHFSLVGAAPLPFFALTFDRAWRSHRVGDAAAAGLCLAWAGFSDPYYAIYCVVIGLAMVARTCSVHRTGGGGPRRRAFVRAIDVLIGIGTIASVLAATHALGTIQLGGVAISVRSLYTPVLVLTLLICLRLLTTWPLRLEWSPSLSLKQALLVSAVMAIVSGLLLSPQLLALLSRAASGDMVAPPVFWRSSAPGLDLMSFLVPNPQHPFAPEGLAEWVRREPGRFEENVAAIPWVALLTLIAAWRTGWLLPRFWTWLALLSGVMALGPFIRIAGVFTYVPTPWTFVRYLPVIGEARMPPRLAIITMLGVAVLLAGALAALGRRFPDRRRLLVAGIGLALAFELLPIPRPLYAATIPEVFQVIARDPTPGSVLNLPFGVRDGLSSLGNYTARSQFYQTLHGKPILGGYLSRVSEKTKQRYLSSPFTRTLIELSEPRGSDDPIPAQITESGPDFLRQTDIRYVVMHTSVTRPALRAFAIEALRLERLDERDGYELYRVERE